MHLTIVCESCGAKFRVGEERVPRGPFKVRCRRCGSVIVSRGPEREPDAARVVVVAAACPADEQVAQPDPWPAVTAAEAGSPLPAPHHPPPGLTECASPSLTAARHEQSVLFSLQNIQALAAASPHAPLSGPSAAPESGLIDIRALARSMSAAREIGAPRALEVDADSAVPMTFSPPVLVPVASPRSPGLLTVVVALGSALTLSLLTLAAVLLFRSPPSVPLEPPSRTVAPPRGAVPPRTPPPARGEELAAPSPRGKVAAAVDSPPTRPPARRARRPRAHKQEGRVETPAHVPQARERTRPGEDPLDKLIRDAVGPQAKPQATRQRPAADQALPEELTKQQIVAGMQGVRSRVRECFDRYRVPGTAVVRVSIAPEGRVHSATVRGVLAGTPTGACLAAAVRSARFPRFRGPANLTIPEYSFVLQ